MAVLHHAFRCALTPAAEAAVEDMLRLWECGDRQTLSILAQDHYSALAAREDLHAAFHSGVDSAIPSWLEPEFISPGLAAWAVLAMNFIPVPTLSASKDTNHDVLVRFLPALGWSQEEVAYLVHGQPIEVMLQTRAHSSSGIKAGGFRHTGGWTPPATTRVLRLKIDELVSEPPSSASEEAREAWRLLKVSRALEDASAMLAQLDVDDWLVMEITY